MHVDRAVTVKSEVCSGNSVMVLDEVNNAFVCAFLVSGVVRIRA